MISNSIFFSIFQCIRIFCNIKFNFFAFFKCIGCYGSNAVRNNNFYKVFTLIEYTCVDAYKSLRKNDFFKSGSKAKCTCIDSLELAACFKSNRFKIIKVIESNIVDGGDILADNNGSYIKTVCFVPGHGTYTCSLFHITGTAYGKFALSSKNEFDILAVITCVLYGFGFYGFTAIEETYGTENFNFTIKRKTFGSEIIEYVIDSLASGQILISDKIHDLAIHFNKTICREHISAFADVLIVLCLIMMSGCRKRGTPFNNRTAAIAVSSAGITCFAASCRFVIKSFHRVAVPISGCYGCKQCSINIKSTFKSAFGSIRKFNITSKYIGFYVNNRIRVCFKSFYSETCAFSIPGPNSYGNTYKNCFSGSSGISFCYSNSCTVVIFVKSVFSFKSRCNDHMIELPFVCKVKLNISCKSFNVLDIFSSNICIVNRVILRNIIEIVVSAKSYRSCSFNSERFALFGNVAHIVSDFKSNGMFARGKSYFRASKNVSVDFCSINGNSINIYFCGRYIKTGSVICGIVRNFCSKRSDGGSADAYFDITDNRSISVIYRITIVKSNIIYIKNSFKRLFRLGIETDKLRLSSVGSRLIRVLDCYVVIRSKIHVAIYPSVFRNIRFGTFCKGFSVALKNKVGVLSCIAAGRRTCIKFSLHCKVMTRSKFFRNIDPHTETCCIHSVCSITKNGLSSNVEEHVIGPLTEASAMG